MKPREQAAAQVLLTDFGTATRDLGVQLIAHGTQTLQALQTASTHSNHTQVKDAIALLMQHNLLKTSFKISTNNKTIVQYTILLDEILARRWFARIVKVTNDRHGIEGAELVKETLCWGRVTIAQIVENVAASSSQDKGTLSKIVDKLKAEGLLCACERRDWSEEVQTHKQQLRFKEGYNESEVSRAAVRRSTKRQRVAADKSDPDPRSATYPITVGGNDAGELRWRVNLRAYASFFRHESISRLVGEKIDGQARQLVETALSEWGRRPEPTRDDDDIDAGSHVFDEIPNASDSFTLDEVVDAVSKNLNWQGESTRQKVRNYFDIMCNEPLCEMAQELNDRYVLKIENLANALRMTLVEGIVLERFGVDACRVIRLLLRKHADGRCEALGQQHYDLKQLAHMALLPDREIRPILMRMLRAGIVSLQEVPRSADHNPRSTTYLWFADLNRACAAVEREIFCTISRLQARFDVEALGTNVGQEAGRLDAADRDAIASFEEAGRRCDALENALLRLYDTVLTLRVLGTR